MGNIVWSGQGLAPPFSQVAQGPRHGGTEEVLMVGGRGGGQGGLRLSGRWTEDGSTGVTSSCLC